MKLSLSTPRLVKFTFKSALMLIIWMTLMRMGFFFVFNHHGYSLGQLMSTFLMGFRFDLRIVGILSLLMLIVGSFGFMHPFKQPLNGKIWLWVLGLLLLVINIFYTIDFAHYAYLSQRLNASALNYLEDVGISGEMVWQSYPVVRLLLLIVGFTAVLYFFIYRQYKSLKHNLNILGWKQRFFWSLSACLLSALLIFGRLNQYPLRWSDAYSLGSDYQANLALNPFESFFNTLKFRGSSYDDKKVQESFAFLSSYYGWDPKRQKERNYSRSIAENGVGSTPNIVLVICESFSAYKSSMWGNPLNTTPFFDSLTQKGLFFDHCFSPSYGTARGVWATLTGLPDVESNNTASRNPRAVDQQTVMNQFSGYEKYYFIGGSPSWANIRGLLMNNIQGLHLYEQDNLNAPRLDVWGISDKNLFLEANKILQKETKPFFAIIQTADNHRPYTIPAEDSDFVVKSPSLQELNRYGFKDQVNLENKLKEYNAFRYTDYTFRKFMEAAQQSAYFSNTIFVFVGDHGIPGDVGNMLPKAWTEQRLASEHVPLLFYAPRFIHPFRDSMICSQLDVMPTIAGLSGHPVQLTTLGRNLLDPNTRRDPFAFIYDPDNRQVGVVKGNMFYKRHMQSGKEELVSIKNNAPLVKDSSLEIRKQEMHQLSEGIYQTASYLLLHNKKQ